MDEFWIFLAIAILDGNNTMQDNWRTDEYMPTPIFSKLKSRDRWKQIFSSLHFCNNEAESSKSDKFWKLSRVFNMLNRNCGAECEMAQEISVDESLVL